VAGSLSMRHVWYEGDHPARRRPLTGKLRVGDDGITVRSWHGSVAFPWDSITGLRVAAAADDQRGYSPTWVVLLGLGAAAPRPMGVTHRARADGGRACSLVRRGGAGSLGICA
jgi:Bacterial PH domain